MALTLNRYSAQEAANMASDPFIVSKTVNFDGGTNNGKILAAATLSTNLTGSNNDLDYTANTSGSAGNLITVEYRDPASAGASLSVSLTGNVLVVNLATAAVATAQGTLTSDATAPSNNDTVVIGPYTYTFKTALTNTVGDPFEVLIGASAAIALDNLKAAVNRNGGEGTTYGTGTPANYAVDATTNTDTTQLFVATNAGAAGNTIATTEASTHLSFGAATLTGGNDGGAITSTAAQVDAAIAADGPSNTLVAVANKAGNDGSGVVTAMAATALTGGSDGYIELFDLQEDLVVGVYGVCTEDLASGGSATISVGYTSNTTVFIPSTTATTLDVGESIDSTGVLAEGTKPNAVPFWFTQSGKRIRLYVGTATITDGSVTFYAVAERQRAKFLTDLAGRMSVSLGTLIAGEDLTNNRMMVEQRYTPSYISTAATTVVKSGAGHLHTITVNGGTAGTIIVYDNTAGSGTILASFDSTNALATYTLNVSFAVGLTVVTGAATKVTVSFR